MYSTFDVFYTYVHISSLFMPQQGRKMAPTQRQKPLKRMKHEIDLELSSSQVTSKPGVFAVGKKLTLYDELTLNSLSLPLIPEPSSIEYT